MHPSFLEVMVWFIVLLVVFRGLEWTRPAHRRLRMMRRGFWTDVGYWLLIPVTTWLVATLSIVIAVVPFAWLAYGSLDKSLVEAGFGPLGRLPLWQQGVAVLVLVDFIGYWMHRWFHGRRLWRFHAVHHSSTELDWLSSVRVHPLNDVAMRVVTTLPVLMLGFAPLAVAGALPWLTLMAFVLHANVDWDWGPLRAVIASPRFHRWHHSDEASARGRNFAGLLPLWDVVFGTYHMPANRVPASFGAFPPVPEGLLVHMLHPFRRSP